MSIWGTRLASGHGVSILTLCALVLGCGKSTAVKFDESQARMKTLALLFAEFVGSNNGRLPADEAQLKTFIRQKRGQSPAGGAVANPDDLFVSARDGQPLVIKYGQKAGVPGRIAPSTIIAYEQTGVGGKRLVVLPTGGVAELDADSFATAMSDQTPNKN